jgi:hypothetical protein
MLYRAVQKFNKYRASIMTEKLLGTFHDGLSRYEAEALFNNPTINIANSAVNGLGTAWPLASQANNTWSNVLGQQSGIAQSNCAKNILGGSDGTSLGK